MSDRKEIDHTFVREIKGYREPPMSLPAHAQGHAPYAHGHIHANPSYITPPMTPPTTYTYGSHRRGSDSIISPIRSTQITPPTRNMPRSTPASFTFGNARRSPEQNQSPNYVPSASPMNSSVSPRNRITVQDRLNVASGECNTDDDEDEDDEPKGGRSFLSLVRNISIKRQQRRKKTNQSPVVIVPSTVVPEEPVATRLEKKTYENGILVEKVDINYDWFPADDDNPILNNKTCFNHIATIVYCEDDSEPIQISNTGAFDGTLCIRRESILKQKNNLAAEKELYFAKKMDKILPESIMKMTEYRVSRSSDPIWKTKCANYRREQIFKSTNK